MVLKETVKVTSMHQLISSLRTYKVIITKAIKVPNRKIPMSGWGRLAEEAVKQTKTMSKQIQSALLTNEGFQRCIQRYNTVKAVGTAEVYSA